MMLDVLYTERSVNMTFDEENILNFEDGTCYIGEVKNDIPYRFGVKLNADGSVNKFGNFDGENFQGMTIYDSDDAYYAQELKNGKIVKFTYWVIPTGECYFGGDENGIRNGQAYVVDNKDNIFVGEYKNSKKNGLGIMLYNNGNVYIGEWEDNLKNGLGKYITIDGEIYYGGYKDGFRNGHGVMEYEDGTGVIGEFKDDEYVG